MPAPEKNLVLTGARARLLLNGVKIGWATNVSIGEEIAYEPVEVLDNIEVQEHVPTAYRVTFTAGRVRIVGQTWKSQGFMPKGGANAEERLTNIINQGDITAIIEDNQTGQILATIEQVRVASHNYTVNARGIVGNDVSFVGVRIKDESEI
jgi:hypothetical protein